MATGNRRTHPALTPQRIAELRNLAKKIDREEAQQIKAEGQAILLRHETVKNLIRAVKEARLAKGLSLGEVGERSSIGKANLCRLETDLDPNPTLDTLLRYAAAVGVEIRVNVGKASQAAF
jgi:predicted Zn-dependent protease